MRAVINYPQEIEKCVYDFPASLSRTKEEVEDLIIIVVSKKNLWSFLYREQIPCHHIYYLVYCLCDERILFLYLVVVDERSSSNVSDHSCSPPSKRYRKQCKEVQQKSLIRSSPTDCDESTSRSGVRRSDLGLLTFSDSSPNTAYNIHSRDHRMGKLNKLNMDPFELSSSDRGWTELNVWRHCISTPQIFMKNWGLL